MHAARHAEAAAGGRPPPPEFSRTPPPRGCRGGAKIAFTLTPMPAERRHQRGVKSLLASAARGVPEAYAAFDAKLPEKVCMIRAPQLLPSSRRFRCAPKTPVDNASRVHARRQASAQAEA